MNRKETGALGEQVARQFLVQRGYKILETNWRCKEGEVDIIAARDGVVAFVEVRTRRSYAYGSAEESITPRKQAHMRAVAQRYCEAHFDVPANWAIDVVAVQLDGDGRPRINHIQNAVEEA